MRFNLDSTKTEGIHARVLLVHNDSDQTRVIQTILSKLSHMSLVCANTVSSAVQYLGNEHWDIVLLGHGVGDEIVETMSKLSTLVPDVPFLVLIDRKNEELGIKLVQAGAQDYVQIGQYGTGGDLLVHSILCAMERHRIQQRLFNMSIGQLRKKQENKTSNRLLVVDDDEDTRKLLSTILEGEGYLVDTAESGEEALKKSEGNLYDLILMEVHLPDMKGTELLNRIYDPENRTVRVIVTGHPSFENIMESVNNGAEGYLVKPVETGRLLGIVKERLGKQNQKRDDENYLPQQPSHRVTGRT